MAKVKVKTKENLDTNYIEELTKSLPKLKKELETLREEKEKVQKYINSISILSVPFTYCSEDNVPYLSNEYAGSWENLKDSLYSKWRGVTKKHTVMTGTLAYILYVIMHIITIAFALVMIISGTYRIFKVNMFAFMALTYIVMEAICGIISTWYYLIRPNRINKKEKKRELKKLSIKEKTLKTDIITKENLIETYKIATIDPNKEFSRIKKKSANELREIVEDTVNNILPTLNEGFTGRYSGILERCNTLLDMAEEDSRIVTEISKIYIIYINDINNILAKSSETNIESINTLLNNFEAYIDRKINKFNKVSDLLIENDINALNNAFMEED